MLFVKFKEECSNAKNDFYRCYSLYYLGENPKPAYGGGNGADRQITDAEREMLVENTERLIRQFEEEEDAKREAEAERVAFENAIQNEKRETRRAREKKRNDENLLYESFTKDS